MPLCVDYKFSRAVLHKISFVSSLSLSFSSLTAFRSAVDEATSESDNPRFSTRLENLHFLLPMLPMFLPDLHRAFRSRNAIADNLSCPFARDHYRVQADEKRFSNSRLLHIGCVITQLEISMIDSCSDFLPFCCS